MCVGGIFGEMLKFIGFSCFNGYLLFVERFWLIDDLVGCRE